MSIFQKSIINKYLKNLDNEKVSKAFEQFKQFYGDKLRLSDILQLKEENYQEGFLREIFVQSLGYTIRPDLNYNLTTEYKNQTDSKKADGAIILNNSAIGVIELKSARTFNLENIKNQAFNYKHNQPDCRYVVTSNFHYLRFYIDNSTEYEEFDLFEMANSTDARPSVSTAFKLFYLILSQESIFNNIPLKMKEETKYHEENISDKFYKDYKAFKDQIFENLVKNNPQYDKLTLFKKSQKLLDRLLFVYFGEDCGLCPPNSIQIVIDQWKTLKDNDAYVPLYNRFQKLFGYLDKGYKGNNIEFPSYNGGLFQPDDLLDNDKTIIDDKILLENTPKLSAYDFNTDIDVNILGHIFEHSLNEIEEISAELKGESVEKSKTKRKKDGVFYTPKYITTYIVENTIGKLCKSKQEEFEISEIEIIETYSKNGKITKQGKELYTKLQEYKNWLLTLKILDPACGSGAFLNSALDFLIKEHKQIDDLISDLTGDKLRMFDTDKNILENNIFGVDINDESVEIAKLSLWLRTAKKDRKLSDLNNNIKCGNSLIDNKEIAGEKAFNWHKEFPQVFGIEVIESEIIELKKEESPDYLKLIKEKSLEAKTIAEKAKELSNEAIELTRQVYEYAEKLENVKEPDVQYANKGGFDVIIGNPPYGAKLEAEIQDYLNKHYIKGGSETVISFIKLCYDKLMKSKGIFGFIIPKAFTFASNYESIREYILDDITEIVDCKKVWKEVLLEQVMLFFSKSIHSLSYLNGKLSEQNVIKIGKISKNNFQKFGFLLNDITSEELEIGLKLNNINHFINDISTNTRGGIFQKFISDKGNIEVLGGAEIQRNGITSIKGKIDFEIIKDDSKNFINENSILVQNIVAHIENPTPHIKITACYPENKNFAIVDTINQITFQQNYDCKVFWLLFNSKLLNWYCYRFIFAKAIRTMHFDNSITSRIPVPEIFKKEPFIEKADLIIMLNKQLKESNDKFTNNIQREFSIEKLSKKLQYWYQITYGEFLKEFEKLKIKLTLNRKAEWEEYFNVESKKAFQIKVRIIQSTKQINEMIYNLYELSTEEINLIENSTK